MIVIYYLMQKDKVTLLLNYMRALKYKKNIANNCKPNNILTSYPEEKKERKRGGKK